MKKRDGGIVIVINNRFVLPFVFNIGEEGMVHPWSSCSEVGFENDNSHYRGHSRVLTTNSTITLTMYTTIHWYVCQRASLWPRAKVTNIQDVGVKFGYK